jgi:hypothetical protein
MHWKMCQYVRHGDEDFKEIAVRYFSNRMKLRSLPPIDRKALGKIRASEFPEIIANLR